VLSPGVSVSQVVGGFSTAFAVLPPPEPRKKLVMADRNYWIGVVSRSHVQLGVQGGVVQLGHGKRAPLARMRAGDGLVMYSPRTSYPDGEALQSFTAIGIVTSGQIYQVEMSPDFKPYRVDVSYLDCRETPIKPLVERLSFIRNKTNWGAAFRFGQIKIPADDFALIAQTMGRATFDQDAGRVTAERVRAERVTADRDAAERGAAA
jgi:EVE domain